MAWMRNWFSNMLPLDWPLVYQGIAFTTVEHFYQAMKLPKWDVEGRREVALLSSPYEAKRMCRTEKLRAEGRLRPDWKKVQLDVMEHALRVKFAEGTSWRRKLLEAGDDLVERNNWHDNFFGDCLCGRCREVPGQNHLGRILQRIREEAVGTVR